MQWIFLGDIPVEVQYSIPVVIAVLYDVIHILCVGFAFLQ
jgi:hypothetical protein